MTLASKTFGVLQQLGKALSYQGRYEDAVEAFETGVELNRYWWPLHFSLGQTHLELGNYREALSALENARILKEDGDVLVNIGAAHAGLGEVEEALAALELGLNRRFSPIAAIEGSRYYTSIREDPRFQRLIEDYRQQ